MAQPTSTQRHAFAPPAASSSSSASTSFAPYDVFLNHRGPDIKNTFAGHLYHRLKSRGLQVFLDRPELQAGGSIHEQIKAAIEVAHVDIAIFSKTYAESNWCLDELVLMLNSRGTILPVFYDVEPSDLRWSNKRKYAEAFEQYEEKKRYDSQTIQRWKTALSSVADISGFELKACNGDEVELVDMVVQRVLNLVPRPVNLVPKPALYVAQYKIGLQEKLEGFERKVLSPLEGQGRPEARVLGIVGSGGIGKSTLAREFFNRKSSNYMFSSFLSDVRESAATKSLTHLQSKLIEDIRGKNVKIESWEEGVGILEKELKSCHALIILDDVDHRSQLDAFLPIKRVLHPMSSLLLTSRDTKVLKNAKIADSSIYRLKGLDPPKALELFCWHAFSQHHPLPGFKVLAEKFVKACDGLPLSLEVFGAMLCDEVDQSYWEEQLDGLQKLPRDIQVRLKISYDSLEPEEQQIFLDISCFCIGEDKDTWIRIWGGSGWKGSVGLRNLENKCLVELDEKNKIRMHDHLRDMGRDIAKDPSMPRRLWGAKLKDVYDLLDQSSSSVIEVRGITLSTYLSHDTSWEEGRFSEKVFGKLQLLQVRGGGVELVKGILSRVQSPNLIWFSWRDCGSSFLPSCIPMRDLRVLQLSASRLEKSKWERLWQPESQAPLQLRELNIHKIPILEFPDSLQQLKYLEKIEIDSEKRHSLDWWNTDFRCLPEGFCNLRSLKCLNLRFWPNLEIPSNLWNLSNLQYIDLSGCLKLKALPHSFGDVTNLREIVLYDCINLEVVPNSIENLKNLQKIDLRGCGSLKMLPNSIEKLTNLEEIKLAGCESLEVLPNAFGTLTNLQLINLAGCISLKMLPNSMENLTKLEEIYFADCESLKVLPDAFGTWTNLRKISLEGCISLKMLPNSIENLTNLEEINFAWCQSLEVLPDAFGTWTNLRQINLQWCKSLNMLPNSIENLTNLEEIKLAGCESLEVLPNAFGALTNLQLINLEGCKSLKMLPNSMENLTNLEEINFADCESLELLPDAFGTWTNLRKINLQLCKSLEVLPDAFGNLTNLQEINLARCKSLKVLPNSMENLTSLQEINLDFCQNLKVLPHFLEKLTNLRRISLSHLYNLSMASNSFGNLLQLTHLHLSCNSSLTISNETLGNITTLECIDLSGCLQMEVLPFQLVHQSSLKRLNLLGTNIKELPSAPTVCLINLEVLILGSPFLKVLPPWLGSLTHLEKLQLHGCPKLKCLPASVGELSQMRELAISKCGIQYLPPAVMQLNNLRTEQSENFKSTGLSFTRTTI